MSQTNFVDVETSDAESVAESKIIDLDNINLMTILLATKADGGRMKKKRDKKIKHTDTAKQKNMFNKMFDYIYIAQCKKLFSVIWYDNLIHANKVILNKSLF